MNITFRPLSIDALPDLVRWYNDPEITRFLDSKAREGTTLAIQQEKFRKHEADKDRQRFLILADNKPVGHINLIEINNIDRNAGISIIIGEKDYWGTGVAKDAIKFVIKLGFEKLKLHRIWLHVYEPNIRAIKLYENMGFVQEGCHKEMAKIDGKYCNELFMAITNPTE